jgi:hypothetical protein
LRLVAAEAQAEERDEPAAPVAGARARFRIEEMRPVEMV